MAKIRQHNEYFRPLVKTTCECGKKKTKVWSWGEYHNVRWYTVKHFCKDCYNERVKADLLGHAGPCGCKINLVGYQTKLPRWLNLSKPRKVCCAA